MEGAPILPEGEADAEKSSDKKKKRKSKELGGLAVEPKAEQKTEAKSTEIEAVETAVKKSKEANPEATLDERVEAAAAETKPASEAEAPAETVGEQEVAELEPQLIELNRELETEPADDPAVERFRELIVAEGKDSETAYQEVMQELGVEAEPETEAEPEIEAAEETPEEVVIDLSGAESAPEEPAEDDAAASTAAAGGGRGTPPPPTSTGPGTPLPPPGGGRPLGPAGPASFNTAPIIPAAANRSPQVPRYELDDRANPAAMALFGGIIGYLIGRRRGRIKTEKKLLPIQKKLEKQVTSLHWQLQEKEARIRRASAEKVKQEGPATLEVFSVAAAAGAERAAAKPKSSTERVVTKTVETQPGRRPAPEAHQLHGSQKSSEHIGHVLVAAEALPALARSEAASRESIRAGRTELQKTAEKMPELPSEKRVETLNRAELLSLSEKIEVSGSSLRQIYETHLIGERGLRRLIMEHLRGGDLKKALRQEVVEREIDFERDPAMRDQAAPDASALGGGTATLHHMIKQAADKVDGDEEETAYYKARANYELAQHAQTQKQRRIIDISLTVMIIVLIGVIVGLYFMNR